MEKEDLMLTPEGLEKLEQELKELKTVKRKELSERLKVAISYGDLKENSEYHSAKDDQAFMETRILQLEGMLKRARVVDTDELSLDQVGVGMTVRLLDIEFNESLEYRIVSPIEADVEDNKISYESPLGKELIGKRQGDKIEVQAPAGVVQYELLDFRIAE